MKGSASELYDVAILGAGFEGGLLGTILASNGAKVLIIDSGVHPRFALGESTVRHTFRMIKIMAERYNVPYLKEKFYSGEHVHKYITSSCGEKRNFGFVYHREGQHQNPEEANQLVIPPFREGYEAHLFRQDIDAFLTYTALHYGATVKYKTQITDVDITSENVTLKSAEGETFKAKYLADGSGISGQLPRLLDLREDPPRFKLQTRCLFTHMIDVLPYDDLDLPHGVPKYPERWYNGTCHHVFDGGWLWIIPFNNRKGATNPLVSIGLSYDMKKYPKPMDKTPEEEWQEYLDRFPSVKEQFKHAKVARDWVSSGRLQASCKQVVGDRYCVLAASGGSGFIDALFSRGMANSAEVVNAAASRLLQAIKDDDFSAERFEYVERLQNNNIVYNDKLVNCSYIAFRDYDLWNAWFRIWALGVGMGDLRLAYVYRTYLKTRDEAIMPDNEEPGLFFGNIPEFKTLFDAATAEVEAVEEGKLGTKEAASRIFKMLADIDFSPPVNRIADPERKWINQGRPIALASTLGWLLTKANPKVREQTLGTISDLGPLRLLQRRNGKKEEEKEALPSKT